MGTNDLYGHLQMRCSHSTSGSLKEWQDGRRRWQACGERITETNGHGEAAAFTVPIQPGMLFLKDGTLLEA